MSTKPDRERPGKRPSASGDFAALRAAICAEPARVLDDPAILRAFIQAERTESTRNIVDLRDVLVGRAQRQLSFNERARERITNLAEARLTLEERARKAALLAVEARSLDALATTIRKLFPSVLAIDAASLALEEPFAAPEKGFSDLVSLACGTLRAQEREAGDGRQGEEEEGGEPPAILMRPTGTHSEIWFGPEARHLRSEALVRLGERGRDGAWAGLLAFGARDGAAFTPDHQTGIPVFLGALVTRLVDRLVAP